MPVLSVHPEASSAGFDEPVGHPDYGGGVSNLQHPPENRLHLVNHVRLFFVLEEGISGRCQYVNFFNPHVINGGGRHLHAVLTVG